MVIALDAGEQCLPSGFLKGAVEHDQHTKYCIAELHTSSGIWRRRTAIGSDRICVENRSATQAMSFKV